MQERYHPFVVGVNTTVSLADSTEQIAGFLAKTAGTLTVVNNRGVTIVDAVPVTAGVYLPLPFILRGNGGGAGALNLNRPTVTTAGGASGTLGFA